MASPRRNNVRAAMALVDAYLLGAERAATKNGITRRSISNYRRALKKDAMLAELFARHLGAVREQRWAEGLESEVQVDLAQPDRMTERGARRRSKRFVYFIGEVYGAVKIGVAANPQRRLNQLQTAFPYKLILLHVMETDEATQVEAALHREYAAKRLNGEWFALTPADLAHVKRMK
jgi:predicted GIY-YIG superfamily endonuclease